MLLLLMMMMMMLMSTTKRYHATITHLVRSWQDPGSYKDSSCFTNPQNSQETIANEISVTGDHLPERQNIKKKKRTEMTNDIF
jgi:hypothetical protein